MCRGERDTGSESVRARVRASGGGREKKERESARENIALTHRRASERASIRDADAPGDARASSLILSFSFSCAVSISPGRSFLSSSSFCTFKTRARARSTRGRDRSAATARRVWRLLRSARCYTTALRPRALHISFCSSVHSSAGVVVAAATAAAAAAAGV